MGDIQELQILKQFGIDDKQIFEDGVLRKVIVKGNEIEVTYKEAEENGKIRESEEIYRDDKKWVSKTSI